MSVESKGNMIHLLKAGSKTVPTEYKRRIVPIAATLADFQADQQKHEMAANERSKASKKKKQGGGKRSGRTALPIQHEATQTTETLPGDELKQKTVLDALSQLESEVELNQRNLRQSLAQFKAKITKTQATAPGPKIGKKIGTFTNTVHNVSGTVYALDKRRILIEGFKYDGKAPDAFFLGGTHGQPSESGEVFHGIFSQVVDLHFSGSI